MIIHESHRGTSEHEHLLTKHIEMQAYLQGGNSANRRCGDCWPRVRPPGGTVVTVRSSDPQVAQAYRASFNEFTRRHPDIEVHVNVVASSSYFDTLRTDVAGGSAEDIFWISNAYFAPYADSGRLIDITDSAAGWEPSVVEQFTRDGSVPASGCGARGPHVDGQWRRKCVSRANGAAVPAVLTAQRTYFDFWAPKGVDVSPFFDVCAVRGFPNPAERGSRPDSTRWSHISTKFSSAGSTSRGPRSRASRR